MPGTVVDARPTPPAAASFYPLALTLARQLARADADVDDLIQEGLIELHRSLATAGDIRDPTAFATTVLRRRMHAYYRTDRDHGSIDDEETEVLAVAPWQDTVFETREFFEDYLSDLEEAHGERAAWAAINLLSPGPDVGQQILMEMHRKARELDADPDKDLRGVRTARVSQQQLLRALGISAPAWFNLMRKVRRFTYGWLQRRELPLPTGYQPVQE